MSRLPEEFFATLKALRIAETPAILWVSVAEQRLRLLANRLPAAEYPVSTAKNGVGCRRNSFQTPTGIHRVAEKIGDGQPVGMVFKERKPTTVLKSQIPSSKSQTDSNQQSATPNQARLAKAFGVGNRQSDLILTRILWLEGLEPGVNQGGEVDTFSRYIYIHGTNHEELIGQPASHGCIRMRNADVSSLFDKVKVGSLVWIA